MTSRQARTIFLSFPAVEEKPHHGHPSYRVRNKIFATLWPDKQLAVLKLDLADQKDLLSEYPKVFSLNAWSRQGWTNVHLKHTDASLFRALATDAWHRVAPNNFAEQSVRPGRRNRGNRHGRDH